MAKLENARGIKPANPEPHQWSDPEDSVWEGQPWEESGGNFSKESVGPGKIIGTVHSAVQSFIQQALTKCWDDAVNRSDQVSAPTRFAFSSEKRQDKRTVDEVILAGKS